MINTIFIIHIIILTFIFLFIIKIAYLFPLLDILSFLILFFKYLIQGQDFFVHLSTLFIFY